MDARGALAGDPALIPQRITWWRRARKLSQQTVADLAGISRTYLSRIETGVARLDSRSTLDRIARALGVSYADLTGQPPWPDTPERQAAHTAIGHIRTRTASPQIAQHLDAILETGGALAALTGGDSGEERLRHIAANPRRIDLATIALLHEWLAEQRTLEDQVGSAQVVTPVRATLATVTEIVRQAPDNQLRPLLVDTAAQWAQFAAWLSAATSNFRRAERLYLLALEWATEAGNPHMAATALSMRGHLAWMSGRLTAMVELSQAAQWPPASRGVRAVAVQQEARGLALLGQTHGVDDRLDEAEELAIRAADHPDREPPWLYFYDPIYFRAQRGLAQLYLGRHEQAVELLTSALAAMDPQVRGSDWVGWYVVQLGIAYHHLGEREQALKCLEEAQQVATRCGSRRLTTQVRQAVHQLGFCSSARSV